MTSGRRAGHPWLQIGRAVGRAVLILSMSSLLAGCEQVSSPLRIVTEPAAPNAASGIADAPTSNPVPDSVDLVFDVRRTLHSVGGFGTHLWADQVHGLAALPELNLRYIRITKGHTTWEQMAAARGFTDRHEIEWVYMLWRAPKSYVGSQNELADVPGFARHWRDLVGELDRRGLRPHYVELMNEPDSDGTWSTRIEPADYNRLVTLTRLELDRAGFEDVGIIGPGLAHLNWNRHNSQWLGALDHDAAAGLAAWSTHSWDDGDLCFGGAACAELHWPEFGDLAGRLDPDKPIWITEYGTKELTFDGRTYPHPDETNGYSSADSMPYAVRVYELSLALLNQGANVLFYWLAEDCGKSWGYVDAYGRRKPVYTVLQNLFPRIPAEARVLSPPQQPPAGLYAAAFLKDRRLVIALANDGPAQQIATIRIDGVRALRVLDAPACVLDHRGDPQAEEPDACQIVLGNQRLRDDRFLEVTLPGYSTLTIVSDVADSSEPTPDGLNAH